MKPPTRLRPLSVLLFLLLLPALTGLPFNAWAQATTPPAFCANPTLQLIDTADTKLSIEQATATDAGAQGCGISGKMRVIVRGNNIGDIAFAGKVNANNELTADSIANFEMPLAGLTLAMNELILEQENNDYRITAKQPRIQIPAEWGGLGGGIPSAQITKEGLKFSGQFEMPDIRAGGFLLKLKGGITPVTGGYEINASGELGIPNLPGVGGCSINAGVVLFAGPDNTRNLAIQSLDATTVSAINHSPANTAISSNQLPGQWNQPTAAEALKLREITAGLNCQNGIPIGTTGIVLIKLQGTISLRPNDQFVQVTLGLASRVKLGDVPVVSGEGTAKITTAPGFGIDLSAAISVLSYQAASAEVSISEAQGFRTKIELSPPLFYASLEIKAWAKDGAFFFTGSGRARVQVCAGCIWKKWFIKMPPFEIRSPDVGADFGAFQDGSWGIKGFISIASWQIGAFINNKGEIKFGNVSDKVLATPSLVAQIFKAQQAANRMGISAAERPFPEYTFAPDGSLIVSARLPLPVGSSEPSKQLRPTDAISPTDVITQADTLFSMAAAGPLAVSLIAPDNTEITPANAGTLLTHKVTFSQSVTTDVDTGLLITNSNYFIDQAVPGNWQVKITGDTATISYTVAVLNPPAPPQLGDLSVDASNKAQSQVTWRVRSNTLPTTITVFANNGPITQTLAYTDASNNRTAAVVPLFQGQAMYTDVLDSLAEVNGQLVTKTIDLSRLESGAYNIWVRLENPSNPPVEGYATAPIAHGSPLQSAKHRYSPEVRVAADGYDALAQLADAAPIGIDNSATLTTSWTTPITVTPEGDGLRVTWKPHPSPDVDAYVLYVGTNPITPTQVIDLDDVIYQAYDADGDLIGEPIGNATLDTIEPGQTYYIWIGAQDDQGTARQGQIKVISAGRIARSNTVMASVPTGDFNVSADAPAYPADVIDQNGDEITATVTATLQINASANLFYPVDVYANLKGAPAGIDADVNDDNPAMALMSPSANRTVQVVFRIEPSVKDGIYTIPVVAYSGAIQKVVNVVINVGEADYVVFVPIVIR